MQKIVTFLSGMICLIFTQSWAITYLLDTTEPENYGPPPTFFGHWHGASWQARNWGWDLGYPDQPYYWRGYPLGWTSNFYMPVVFEKRHSY